MNKLRLPRPRFLRLFFLIACLAATATFVPPARASIITVDTVVDELDHDGSCSLREAIVAANTDTAVSGCAAGNGFDTIILPAGVYTLSLSGAGENAAQTGDLDITEGLSLDGAGRVTTTIDADGLDRVFDVRAGNVQLDGVTITGGLTVDESGAGISVSGGSLTLVNSRVTNNVITGDTYHGGGVYFNGDSLDVIVTWIDNNSATGTGGGIYAGYDSEWTMVNSRVENNSAGSAAGINSHGVALIRNSTISGNMTTSPTGGSGGISSNETLTIVNSTFSGNSAHQGGGALSVGSSSVASLFNVTIVLNIADSDGSNLGDGGGIRIALGTVNLHNTLIARNVDNSPGTNHPDCSGTFTSQGYNLIQEATGCTLNGDTTGNQVGVAPRIDPLADNGGSTPTHALRALSPAVDAGNPSGCVDQNGAVLTIDQRGYARPVNGNATPAVACDIGAFERLSAGPPTPTPSPTASLTPTATSTSTPTPSSTPTEGPSPTVTSTATPGPSPTPTTTPTEGPSPTATNTATPGPSPTATSTATAGPSPTATSTETPGPSPTPTATPELPPEATHKLFLPFFMNEGDLR